MGSYQVRCSRRGGSEAVGVFGLSPCRCSSSTGGDPGELGPGFPGAPPPILLQTLSFALLGWRQVRLKVDRIRAFLAAPCRNRTVLRDGQWQLQRRRPQEDFLSHCRTPHHQPSQQSPNGIRNLASPNIPNLRDHTASQHPRPHPKVLANKAHLAMLPPPRRDNEDTTSRSASCLQRHVHVYTDVFLRLRREVPRDSKTKRFWEVGGCSSGPRTRLCVDGFGAVNHQNPNVQHVRGDGRRLLYLKCTLWLDHSEHMTHMTPSNIHLVVLVGPGTDSEPMRFGSGAPGSSSHGPGCRLI